MAFRHTLDEYFPFGFAECLVVGLRELVQVLGAGEAVILLSAIGTEFVVGFIWCEGLIAPGTARGQLPGDYLADRSAIFQEVFECPINSDLCDCHWPTVLVPISSVRGK